MYNLEESSRRFERLLNKFKQNIFLEEDEENTVDNVVENLYNFTTIRKDIINSIEKALGKSLDDNKKEKVSEFLGKHRDILIRNKNSIKTVVKNNSILISCSGGNNFSMNI